MCWRYAGAVEQSGGQRNRFAFLPTHDRIPIDPTSLAQGHHRCTEKLVWTSWSHAIDMSGKSDRDSQASKPQVLVCQRSESNCSTDPLGKLIAAEDRITMDQNCELRSDEPEDRDRGSTSLLAASGHRF